MTTGATRRSVGLAIVATALVAGPLGAMLALRSRPAEAPATAPAAELFTCPMHPAIVQDHQGTCPICGMKLIRQAPPASGATAPGSSPATPVDHQMGSGGGELAGLAPVTIDAPQQLLIGLRTVVADRGVVGRSLRTMGRVSVDETRVRKVNVKVSGYVEKVFLDFVGKPVRKGQPLFALYSPEILAAENELLVALRAKGASPEGGGGGLVAAARRRLDLWDVPASELERLEREGLPARTVTFVSPAAGVVTRKDIVEGARLEAGAMPYEVVDLSSVWVLADVYETELRFVEPGMAATLHLHALPDRTFTGTVLFVDPMLDPKTRTARVRLAFANPGGEMRPELFGEVTLERPPREALRVPSDALVQYGVDSVVFVAHGENHFEPRRVQTGEAGREYTEIVSGLSEGEAVIIRANFLIDSESSLRASLAGASRQGPGDAGPTEPR